jgi:hypothetical protein
MPKSPEKQLSENQAEQIAELEVKGTLCEEVLTLPSGRTIRERALKVTEALLDVFVDDEPEPPPGGGGRCSQSDSNAIRP